MKAVYINAPGEVEIREIEKPQTQTGRSSSESAVRRNMRK